MIIIYFEPTLDGNSWFLTGRDAKHVREIWQQFEAMCEGLV